MKVKHHSFLLSYANFLPAFELSKYIEWVMERQFSDQLWANNMVACKIIPAYGQIHVNGMQ